VSGVFPRVGETHAVTRVQTAQEAETRAELIELVRVDYEATCSLIDGVVRTSLALRGVGVTLILALLSLAVQKSSEALALCSLAAVPLFLYLDAYHGWLYAECLTRAHGLERILALRYKELERNDDPDIGLDLDVALASHRFGQYSNLPRFQLRRLLRARPRSMYAVLYGSLFALAAAAIAYCFAT
jgi:hypothetical protein